MMNYFNQLQTAFQKNQTFNAHFERNTIQMQTGFVQLISVICPNHELTSHWIRIENSVISHKFRTNYKQTTYHQQTTNERKTNYTQKSYRITKLSRTSYQVITRNLPANRELASTTWHLTTSLPRSDYEYLRLNFCLTSDLLRTIRRKVSTHKSPAIHEIYQHRPLHTSDLDLLTKMIQLKRRNHFERTSD